MFWALWGLDTDRRLKFANKQKIGSIDAENGPVILAVNVAGWGGEEIMLKNSWQFLLFLGVTKKL